MKNISTSIVFDTILTACGGSDSSSEQNDSATHAKLDGDQFTLPLTVDFTSEDIRFDLSLSQAPANNSSLNIVLDVSKGVPASVDTFDDLRTLASVVNAQLFNPDGEQSALNVSVSAIDLTGGNFRLRFEALDESDSAKIQISNESLSSIEIGLGSETE